MDVQSVLTHLDSVCEVVYINRATRLLFMNSSHTTLYTSPKDTGRQLVTASCELQLSHNV